MLQTLKSGVVYTLIEQKTKHPNLMQDDNRALSEPQCYNNNNTFYLYCFLGTQRHCYSPVQHMMSALQFTAHSAQEPPCIHHLRLLVGCLPQRRFHLGGIRWENITIST